MHILKQKIKQILINREQKKYQEQLSLKKKTYHSWITEQEEKIIKNYENRLLIESIQLGDTEKCLTNDFPNKGNEGEKTENAGCYAEFVEACRILSVRDKSPEKKPALSFLQLPFSEAFLKGEGKGENISSLTAFIRNNKTDVILFTFTEGEISEIALPLLFEVFAGKKECVLAYGDEDVRLQKQGERRSPWFKPDWSPDTFLSVFYFGSLAAVRREPFLALLEKEAAGRKQRAGKRTDPWEASAVSMGVLLYELLYGLLKSAGAFSFRQPPEKSPVFHISEVLYHSRREGYGQILSWKLPKGTERQLKEPLVSIVIPSKDNPRVLFTCIHSLLNKTAGISYEIIVVDNGSGEENRLRIEEEFARLKEESRKKKDGYGCVSFCYHYKPMAFNFSRMCNLGASLGKGELLLFLNDDMEIIREDWLLLLAEKGLLPYVGAVGAKLLYPASSIIQHAGITNLRVGPAHKLQFLSDEQNHYYGANRGDHNRMAVTGACLLLKKSLFQQAGGFKEELAVAFNDVDLCYTIHEAGYYNVIRNDVVLYHHESLSRGKDGESEEKQLRLLQEKDTLYERHQELYGKDPFYHKYLTTDMLESEYSPAFRYQVTLDMPWAKVKRKPGLSPNIREDGCVVIGMEAAMELYKWKYGVSPEKGHTPPKEEDRGYYFQGYSFVIGSDNACYKKTLLLQNKETGEVLLIPVDDRYRQDIHDHLKDQINVELTGFAAKVPLSAIPGGRYRFGMLMEERFSRQRLVNWSSWVLEQP